MEARAKAMAKQATEQGRRAQKQRPSAKFTIISLTIAKLRQERALPQGVRKFTKELDTALPGKHTQLLYNSFKRTEASILYLHKCVQG